MKLFNLKYRIICGEEWSPVELWFDLDSVMAEAKRMKESGVYTDIQVTGVVDLFSYEKQSA